MKFVKYQATGNDFILIDNRSGEIQLSKNQIIKLCDRKFGIGADGVILIEKSDSTDFTVNYYNSDGSQSLCGNGSRAAVQFASSLKLVNGKTTFEAYDGVHQAELLNSGIVRLKMRDVTGMKNIGHDLFIHTGSPHYIRFEKTLRDSPIFEEGRKIRYSEAFKPGGTNVNFVEILPDNNLFVRTYERGVENETLSCGTGVTAAALAATTRGFSSPIKIKTLGGELSVEFKTSHSGESSTSFTDIYLIGPAKRVFDGTLEL